jgi:hypothetical protein
MAEETIDKAVEVCKLEPAKPCQTKGLLLDGAHGWTPTLFIRLVQDFGLESEVSSTYIGKCCLIISAAVSKTLWHVKFHQTIS